MVAVARAVKGRQDRRFLRRLIRDGRTQAKQQQQQQQQQQIEQRAVVAQHDDPRNDLESSAIHSGSAAAISPSKESRRVEAPRFVPDADDTVEAESEPTSPQADASTGRRAGGGGGWSAGGVAKDDDEDELPCADLRDLDSEAGIVEAASGVRKEALRGDDVGVDGAKGVGLCTGGGSA